MKAETIIKGALRLVGVFYQGYVLTNDETQDGLATLNRMTASYEFQSFLPDDLTFTDATTDESFPDAYEEMLVYNLAKRLSGEYGYMLSPEDRQIAEELLNNIKAVNAPMLKSEVDPALVATSVYDINKG